MMKRADNRKRQSGFTLVELLAVTAVTIILLGLSAVAVTYYMRVLKITELDNAAREIYMAAQNRAVLLSNRGRLEGLVSDSEKKLAAPLASAGGEGGTDSVDAYYITEEDAVLAELLPSGTIDPALREGGRFYIVYEPESGSVTDVFYAEEEMNAASGFQEFYNVWSAASRNARMGSKPMIGYYGGGMAQAGDIGALFTPVIEIVNRETLSVNVTYKVPASVANKTELEMTLTYGRCTVPLTDVSPTETYSGGYAVFTYTWLLDSLEEGKPRFAGLFSGAENPPTAFGGDFTVTAEVSYGGSSSTASATDNSLFAKGSGGETAYVEYLRHLQNLDAGTSQAANKTAAVQTADIDCGNETYPDHQFVPITNGTLASYDGGGYEIRNLNVTAESAAGKPAGLFSQVSGGGESPWRFSNVRLVNASVTPGTGVAAGALVGSAVNADFDNCWVYWEPEAGHADLRSLLGDDESSYQYQIVGSAAGGLAGRLNGGSIKSCLAATLVKGGNSAGGLLGSASGTISVENSYADCYLTGNSAAGLIGSSGTGMGSLELKNCYAAGFIQNSQTTAAGLCVSTVESAINVYSAMRYPGENGNIVPLGGSGSTMTNAYYLKIDDENDGLDYGKMTGDGFVSKMGSAFQRKNHDGSNPYNLRTALNLDAYSFPGLVDLPHYGDWGAQFNEASLVYYENYADGSYGFQGGNVDYLRDDKTVLLDGYAVALLKSDLDTAGASSLTIIFQYQTANEMEETSETYDPKDLILIQGQEEEYYLAPLPKELINSTYTAEKFYQYLKFSYTLEGEEKTGTYAYSPHFAGTAVKVDEPEAGKAPAMPGTSRLTVSVRTPRHLYMLAQYSNYFNGHFTFRQDLDLDYATYTGYDGAYGGEPFEQAPIGRDYALPFNGVYDGGCHTIKNLVFTASSASCAGLFGYSSGTLRNVVYLMPDSVVSVSRGGGSPLYVGGLVGGNAGTVDNCAAAGVRVSAAAYGGTIYLGGLAGQNSGLIQNCEAEPASLSVEGSTYGRVYAGGLAGTNGSSGAIARSYAVGRAYAEIDRTSKAWLGGFTASNRGYIADCYAGADLSYEGDKAVVYGFCDAMGILSGNLYLNVENFTYRDKAYNASYADGANIEGVRYAKLTAEPSAVSGMSMGVRAAETGGQYPYPSAVRDAAGKPVHYGLWPERMNLGAMGIYYWEKLEIGEQTSYNISLLAVDTDERTITKQTTLSTAHDDGGVVTDYGYGYYAEDTVKNKVTYMITGTGYLINGQHYNLIDAPEDEGVNAALKELMIAYTFHSYHTFGLDENGGGLYQSKQNSTLQNSTFTLKQDPLKVEFKINSFFADSMSVVKDNNMADWTIDAPTDEPGTEENPYGVRSVEQLQFINWNKVTLNTSTVMEMKTNYDGFLYLSHDDNSGKYYWKQSHDLNGGGKTYTPIAEYYDTTGSGESKGYLYGWFGGSYDGDSYVIADVNIKGQTSSCAGLFGVVYNGTLKNIMMYSSDGNGTVTSAHANGEAGTTETKSLWYGIGCLAGVAASDSGSAVKNCAVAGYTVNADIYTASGGWGGSGIGGLLGISNMNLEGCSAVTDIVIPGTAQDNDNMRVGGLVGTCQGSIENCYAGGEIQVETQSKMSDTEKGIYIGGIVGGSYMKPIWVAEQYDANNRRKTIGFEYDLGSTADSKASLGMTDNKLTNCYSYTILSGAGDAGTFGNGTQRIKGLYALGGTGEISSQGDARNHGTCTITNCYYLASQVLSKNGGNISKQLKTDVKDTNNNVNDNVKALTYAELAAGETMCRDLGGAFAPVTSTENGYSIAGKYSYAPNEELMGLNYPFPTILTREGGLHVHYGEWPLNGIVRKNGGEPIELDLFVKPGITDTLTLSAGVPKTGTWTVDVGETLDEDGNKIPNAIVTATVNKMDGTDESWGLTVTATGSGVGVTSLVIRYTAGDVEYTPLALTVNVTAELELRPERPPIKLFTSDETEVELLPYGKDGKKLDNLEDMGIELALDAPAFDSGYFAQAELKQPDEGSGGRNLALTSRTQAGITAVNVSFQYTYMEQAYLAAGSVVVQLNDPAVEPSEIAIELPPEPEPEDPDNPDPENPGQDPEEDHTGTAAVEFGSGAAIKEVTGTVRDNDIAGKLTVKFTDGDKRAMVTVTGLEPGQTVVDLTVTLELDGRTHKVTVKIPVKVTREEPETDEGTDTGDEPEAP